MIRCASERAGGRCRGGRSASCSVTVLRVRPTAPAAALLLQHPLGSLGEGGDGLGEALLGERVVAGARQVAVGEGQLASLGEGDERGGAEREFAAPAADDDSLDPASRAGGLDDQLA